MGKYRRLKDYATYINVSFYEFLDEVEIQHTIMRELINDILHTGIPLRLIIFL
jgi:hypothetical protein